MFGKRKESSRNIVREVNPDLQGGVNSADLSEARRALRNLTNPDSLHFEVSSLQEGVKTDWYEQSVQKGDQVSIEAAAARETDLKERIDNQRVLENMVGYDPAINTKGLPPCKRTRNDGIE